MPIMIGIDLLTHCSVRQKMSLRVATGGNSYFVSDQTLMIVRLIFALLSTANVCWLLICEGPLYFYYLTHWNWMLNCVHFWVGAINKIPTQSPLLKALFASSQSLSWIVSLVYWAVLHDSNQPLVDLVSQTISHSLNLIFPLIDLFLCRIILRFPHVICPVGFTLLYMIVLLIVHLDYGTAWPYKFLDTVTQQKDGFSVGHSIAIIIGFWIVIGVFFGVSMLLIWIRERFGRKGRPEPLEDNNKTGQV